MDPVVACGLRERVGSDGVWSYVSDRRWKTSDGRQGPINGGCSCSLAPDGNSTTALLGGHLVFRLTPVRPGGPQKEIVWKYDGTVDNHRWSSNDPRFVVCEDEKTHRWAVIHIESGRASYLGEAAYGGEGDLYGDFTVGNGTGDPWPATKRNQDAPSGRYSPDSPAKVRYKDDLVFLWSHCFNPILVRL